MPREAREWHWIRRRLARHRRGGGQGARQSAVEAAKGLGVSAVSGEAVVGDPAEVLLQQAEKLGVDLLVVGSKGMQSSTRFLLGSVPNNVSHHTPCDLLIVHTSR